MKGIRAEVGRSHMSGRPWRGLQMTSLVQLRTGAQASAQASEARESAQLLNEVRS